MAKKNKLKTIPVFKTEKEEADFWATHDTTEYNFEDTHEMVELSSSIRSRLEARRRSRLKSLLELSEDQFKKLLKISEQKKINQYNLVKQWIDEGIERELTQQH